MIRRNVPFTRESGTVVSPDQQVDPGRQPANLEHLRICQTSFIALRRHTNHWNDNYMASVYQVNTCRRPSVRTDIYGNLASCVTGSCIHSLKKNNNWKTWPKYAHRNSHISIVVGAEWSVKVLTTTLRIHLWYKEYCHLENSAMQYGRISLTFGRNILNQPHIDELLPDYMTLKPRRYCLRQVFNSNFNTAVAYPDSGCSFSHFSLVSG